MADSDQRCANCQRKIYRLDGPWKHRNWWSNNSVFCDEKPFKWRKARPANG